uniref:CCHC-type domain-containing protein n=1 Tax=Aegilops tauschii subsp. strangulata TaxID=200361 RepID=A0A453IVA5_AEGTS
LDRIARFLWSAPPPRSAPLAKRRRFARPPPNPRRRFAIASRPSPSCASASTFPIHFGPSLPPPVTGSSPTFAPLPIDVRPAPAVSFDFVPCASIALLRRKRIQPHRPDQLSPACFASTEGLLRHRQLLCSASTTGTSAEDATDEEKQEYNDELKQWTKDNKTARVYILGSLTDSLAAEYESDRTACGIMLRLEQDFGEVSLVKVLSLVNKFLTSKMGDKTVNEHFNKLCVLAEELKTAGYPFQEEVQVMVVLNSLPPSWEQFKISFCHSERTLNMRNLRKHLLMEEDRRLNSGKDKASYQPELHLGEYKNNGNRRNWTKRGGGPDLRDKINYKHDRDQRNYRDERRDRVQHGNNNNNSFHKIDKRNYKCHNCGNTGHFGSECTKKRKPNSER